MTKTPKNVYLFAIGFIISIIIGTITHEVGHYIVGDVLGYNATISYNRTVYDIDYTQINSIMNTYCYEINNKLPFPGKEEMYVTMDKLDRDSFWMYSGGMLMSNAIGLLGLVLLFLHKRITISYWVSLFMSFFFVRSGLILISLLSSFFLFNNKNIYSDETKLSLLMELDFWIVPIVLGSLSLVVCFLIYYKLIPKHYKLPFLIGGVIGGFSGVILWFSILGPWLLP